VSLPPETARVAVVIVNYQAYDELRRCLASLGPPCPDMSVVVVDHESDARAADDLAHDFPHVELLRKATNDGFAAGVNDGARVTRAPYLLFINPDCELDARAAKELTSWMERHPGVAVAGPRIRNADGSVQPSARRFPDMTTAIAGRSSWLTKVLPDNPISRRNLPLRDADLTAPTEVDWVSGACMLVRREAFEAVGGMDQGFFLYWEDADFCRRLNDAGWRTMYLPAATAIHVGGRSSRHAADASLEAFHKSALRLYRKHAGALGSLLTPVVFVALRARLAVIKQLVRRKREAS
jgi:GT2 family glycosyltransferase